MHRQLSGYFPRIDNDTLEGGGGGARGAWSIQHAGTEIQRDTSIQRSGKAQVIRSHSQSSAYTERVHTIAGGRVPSYDWLNLPSSSLPDPLSVRFPADPGPTQPLLVLGSRPGSEGGDQGLHWFDVAVQEFTGYSAQRGLSVSSNHAVNLRSLVRFEKKAHQGGCPPHGSNFNSPCRHQNSPRGGRLLRLAEPSLRLPTRSPIPLFVRLPASGGGSRANSPTGIAAGSMRPGSEVHFLRTERVVVQEFPFGAGCKIESSLLRFRKKPRRVRGGAGFVVQPNSPCTWSGIKHTRQFNLNLREKAGGYCMIAGRACIHANSTTYIRSGFISARLGSVADCILHGDQGKERIDWTSRN
ncbi:hypothetical protein DFH07DRAFT_767726 [Mycena maculata]|uniref:Uncharacterized protein n=1 Tax=Mycena maculata TaxID=230809 RepID=A0AAD7JVG1_9AGAR|nr:hypothetical protein DFH07DRAFT_767726 [Mycena maculata]